MRSRVLAQLSAAEQIVGRERIQRACHRQLGRDVVVSRRVNSTFARIALSKNNRPGQVPCSCKRKTRSALLSLGARTIRWTRAAIARFST